MNCNKNINPGFGLEVQGLRASKSRCSGFTLVELLVAIVIVAVLASIALAVGLKTQKKARETAALGAMRQVAAANGQYSVENMGKINTLRWVGDPEEGRPFVGNSFWGRVQPYLFGQEQLGNQKNLARQIRQNLETLFDTRNASAMQGTMLQGSKIYHDGSGLPIPFAFNQELYQWNQWKNVSRVGNTAGVVYMTYGFGLFNEEDGREYVERPTDGSKPSNNIYFLDDKKAMVGFLDGHVEKVSTPIPARRFGREAN